MTRELDWDSTNYDRIVWIRSIFRVDAPDRYIGSEYLECCLIVTIGARNLTNAETTRHFPLTSRDRLAD